MVVVGDAASLNALQRIKLDESLYALSPEELKFYQTVTGLSDETELKQHILDIQTQAYKIFPYPCLRFFMFTKLKVLYYPAYQHVLDYGRTHPDAIFLEMASCFGNDARKVALDGYPVKNIVATDLRRDFWDLGYKLYKDDPSKFPVPFLGGDILDSQFIDPTASKSDTRADLSKLNTLTDLLGQVTFIHATAFFHLFSKEDQRKIGERCVALLKQTPGATIFGAHIGSPEEGIYDNIGGADRKMFCHSPESWEALWKELFGETSIKVAAKLEERGSTETVTAHGPLAGEQRSMIWSVTVV